MISKCSERADDINLDGKKLKISKVSGKIHIINNSGWFDFKTDGNCTGSGTYSDPNVIEDLVIDAGGTENGIWIEGSNVYFRIENCTVYNSSYPYVGIRSSRVNNSQLINNNFSYNFIEMELYYGNNNTISGNTANHNGWYGISLEYCDNNTVSGNTASYNDDPGIYLYYCNNNTVKNRWISN